MTRDIYQEVTDKVLGQLDAGTVPWRIPWNTRDGLHCNYQSKRPYKGINQMLLAMSGYEQPYWMTYKAMKAAGGGLRGERGTQHATLVVLWKRIKVACHEAACPVCHGTGRKHKTIMLLRHYNVFNIEQTTLEPPPPPEPDPDMVPDRMALAAVEAYLERQPSLAFSRATAGAYYQPATDIVNVPPLPSFSSVPAYYSTVFHEFGHSTGHKDRLARKGVMGTIIFGSVDYSDEELVAEMTAAMMLGVLGLFDDDRQKMSAAYIANWRQRLNEDPKLIVYAAARAQRAADYILGVPAYVDETEGAAAT